MEPPRMEWAANWNRWKWLFPRLQVYLIFLSKYQTIWRIVFLHVLVSRRKHNFVCCETLNSLQSMSSLHDLKLLRILQTFSLGSDVLNFPFTTMATTSRLVWNINFIL
jgi:hypothetical protein